MVIETVSSGGAQASTVQFLHADPQITAIEPTGVCVCVYVRYLLTTENSSVSIPRSSPLHVAAFHSLYQGPLAGGTVVTVQVRLTLCLHWLLTAIIPHPHPRPPALFEPQGTDFGLVASDIVSVNVPGSDGSCVDITPLILPFNFTCVAPSNNVATTLPFQVFFFFACAHASLTFALA